MMSAALNSVPVSADGALVHRLGTWLGINARWLKPLLVPIATYLDDRLGFGTRNPVKKWWLDLEIVDGVCVEAEANQRELNIHRKMDTKKSTVGYYHADDMPAPDAEGPVIVNHKQSVARADKLETPEAAAARQQSGGGIPAHYIPITLLEDSAVQAE